MNGSDQIYRVTLRDMELFAERCVDTYDLMPNHKDKAIAHAVEAFRVGRRNEDELVQLSRDENYALRG